MQKAIHGRHSEPASPAAVRPSRNVALNAGSFRPPAGIGGEISDSIDQSPRLQAQRERLQEIGVSHPAPLPANRATVQLEKNIGLGFTDLDDYGKDDAFGKRTVSKANLSKFRESVSAVGPGDFVSGVASQRVGGGIQNVFTSGIRTAMAESLTIKQNLAGFTRTQIDHAHGHPPILNDGEYRLSVQHSGKIAEQGAGSAQAWDCMKYVPDSDGGWSPEISAISVWELAHLLHNRTLFEKTEFYNYSSENADPIPLNKMNLEKFGVVLNDEDLKTLDELGVPAAGGGGFSLWDLLCCCWK